MRFGMSGGFLPNNMDDLTAETAQRVSDLGFSGMYARFSANDPFETSSVQCNRVRDLLADHGLRMYQCTGYWQCMVHPDASERKKAVRTIQEALRVAADLGARGIDTGPGSLNATGPWNPHPDNWDPVCRDRVIECLKACAPAAEDHGVYLSLEGHQVTVLESAEAVKEILDAVGSRWLRSDLDPANWIDLRSVFRTTEAIHHMFDVLGDHIVSGHAKDIRLNNAHVIHMPTDAPGTGMLDFKAYIQRMEALDPDYPLIVEGANAEQMPEASRFLHETAEALGIEVRGAG